MDEKSMALLGYYLTLGGREYPVVKGEVIAVEDKIVREVEQ